MDSFPAHFGIKFTPTTHSNIPASIDPSQNQLPQNKPFVTVVTGAGKGLGYHIALAFAQAGATGLSISSRTLSDLDDLAAEIKKVNPEVDVLKSVCDTTSQDSVNSLENSVRQKFDRVDVVIANAGVISKYISTGSGDSNTTNLPVGIVEDDDWSRVLDINIGGTWRIARAFTPLLTETKDGPQTLIANSSLAGHSTNSAFTPIAYNVSKLACKRLVEHIDNDHREKHGVHAYALHPGAVLTPQTQGHKGDVWGDLLADDVGLAGAFCVWLGREKKGWLSGRYVSCNWDVEELAGMKDRIEGGDLLKFRMAV